MYNSRTLWQSTSRCRLILLFALIALIVLLVHLQDYVSISRFQHYGIALLIFGLGWLLESAWSFRKLSTWARMSYFSTCLFFLSVGLVFFNNSWLDRRVSVSTEETQKTERVLVISYLVFILYLAAVWTKWIKEETRTKSAQPSENG